MHYLTRWRKHVETGWLQEEEATIGGQVFRLGYGSGAASSRALKRYVGVSPGAARRGAPETSEALIGDGVGATV